jgi:rRNA maturation endonuclease Nob1
VLRELDALKSNAQIDAEIESQVAALRRAQDVCPACGRPVNPKDHFCAQCGYDLTAGGKTE